MPTELLLSQELLFAERRSACFQFDPSVPARKRVNCLQHVFIRAHSPEGMGVDDIYRMALKDAVVIGSWQTEDSTTIGGPSTESDGRLRCRRLCP